MANAFCMYRDVTNGFQLYQSDPSGNYGGWKATAIGANSQGAQNILKQDFKDEITLDEAVKLIIKVCNMSHLPTERAQHSNKSTEEKCLCR